MVTIHLMARVAEALDLFEGATLGSILKEAGDCFPERAFCSMESKTVGPM